MPENRRTFSNLYLAGALVALTGVSVPLAAPDVLRADDAPQQQQGGGGKPDLVVVRDVIRRSLGLKKLNVVDGSCALFEQCVGGTGSRRLLEFDTAILNQGGADLELGKPSEPLYEFSRCHMHWHLRGSLEYTMSRGGNDTVSFFDTATGQFSIRNQNAADATADTYGLDAPGVAIAGDWDGDGTTTVGRYDPATSTFRLSNGKRGGSVDVTFAFKPAGAPRGTLQPIAGDWDGNGVDSVGLYDKQTGTVYLKNRNKKSKKDVVTFSSGASGANVVAIAGDWDGDDDDTAGFYDADAGTFRLKNQSAAGAFDAEFAFGGVASGLAPLAGDWDQDGDDTVGVYDAATGQISLRNENAAGDADVSFAVAPGLVAIAGDWDYNFGAALPLIGHKQAFCWLDTQRFQGGEMAKFHDCNNNQGLTRGWADLYVRGTDCQWIDLGDLPGGVYQLRVSVNGARAIQESNYDNNDTLVKVRIPDPRDEAARPKVTVTSPREGRKLEVGKPVTIRWRVEGETPITHQELWIARVAGGAHSHLNETKVIDANIPAGARSYTWTPTEEFAIDEARLFVWAQNDQEIVGGRGGSEKVRFPASASKEGADSCGCR